MNQEWVCPEAIKPYLAYANYGERTEELYNHKATEETNIVVWTMKAETTAQVTLLLRLHAAGLLKEAA